MHRKTVINLQLVNEMSVRWDESPTRSRIAWTESGATTVRAELLARQPQVQVCGNIIVNSAVFQTANHYW